MTEKGIILVVDDNETLVSTISLVLKRKGYHVETAFNGQDAIDMVSNRSYDLILMDIKMPGMDGMDALKQIMAVRSDAKIVIMTAYDVENLVSEALKIGALDVLRKPFDMGEVLRMIDEIG